MSKSLLVKLLVALLVVILLVFLYAAFRKSPASQENFVAESTLNPSQVIEGREFLQTLQNLRRLRLDGTIFSDPAFIALVDFSQKPQEKPKGRNNPFAPVSPGENFFVRGQSVPVVSIPTSTPGGPVSPAPQQ